MNKICTSIEQSKKLIGLGINTNTADMHYWQNVIIAFPFRESEHQEEAVPLWSLSGLLELIPNSQNIKMDNVYYSIVSFKHEYGASSFRTPQYDNPLDATFEMVCWLLENGHIKK